MEAMNLAATLLVGGSLVAALVALANEARGLLVICKRIQQDLEHLNETLYNNRLF